MSPIPDDVRRFVLTSVPSVPYLEAALLFHRERATAKTPAEVARALYIQQRAAEELLLALQAAGIVAADGEGFRFQPSTDALGEALDSLSRAYASNLIEITNLIHNVTQKNAQRFADAFKLRKDL